MEKKPTVDFNKVCDIIAEVNETFNTKKRRDDTIGDRVQEYLTLRSIECPELEIEYIHVCKMIWEYVTSPNTDFDNCLAFDEIIDILERAYCITEDELRSFKKSVVADLRTEITEDE